MDFCCRKKIVPVLWHSRWTLEKQKEVARISLGSWRGINSKQYTLNTEYGHIKFQFHSVLKLGTNVSLKEWALGFASK